MRLHNKSILISPVDAALIEAINALGINTIFSNYINNLISYERYHADMQLLKIKNRIFVPANAVSLIDRISVYSDDICICKALETLYPHNVALNAALVGNNLFCKVDALAAEVRDFCINNDIRLVNVNQGYAKCSTLIVNDNAIITADPTIHKAATDVNIDALLINQGHIVLDDKNYGFIGGASGVIGDNVLFFGDLDTHPDAESIKLFLKKYNMRHISLYSGKLKDIGGFVLLN